MADIDKTILEELIKLYNEQKREPQYTTFFEVIGRARDEDLISRMLAHILSNSRNLCAALLDLYTERANVQWNCDELYIKDIVCEKIMGNGRADIFIEAEGFTLTVENKINSWENGGQTITYYNYVCSHYQNAKNAFIYLKPDYNSSKPRCVNFVAVNYSELLALMDKSCEEGLFEEDFKRHIKKYLIKWNGNIMKSDQMVLKHYSQLKEMLDSAETKYHEAKREIGTALLSGQLFGDEPIKDYRETDNTGEFVCDITKDIWHRISRNKIWWNDNAADDKEKYYFYLELVLADDPAEITAQMVVKCYGKPYESVVRKFMDEKGCGMIDGRWINQHYFVSLPRGNFKAESDVLSDGWRNELFEYIKSTLSDYLIQMNNLFEEFQAWVSSK